MSHLELCELVKYYHGEGETVRAVDGVSLRLGAGEFVALYGPSGSGKTTLLLLAAGLIAPESGRVLFAGSDISSFSAAQAADYLRRDVGVVFQSCHLMAGASALTNAAMKIMVAGDLSSRRAREQARPWLDRVGLGDRCDAPPHELSMGQRQRVAIARALANEPRLLLCDEPTGNLDSKRGGEILGLLRDICHERQIPGLIVTHDPRAIDYVDRACTLQDGKLHDGVRAELAVQ